MRLSPINKLRAILAIFFGALAIPTAALIVQALDRLQWEAFHQHQVLAEEFARRIDARFAEIIRIEDARAFTEYAFFNVLNPAAGNLLQRSPLAVYPPPSTVPGLIGYFQVDASGEFSSPVVPAAGSDATASGLTDDELATRKVAAAELKRILAENRLLSGVRGQQAAENATVGEAMPARQDDADFAGAAVSSEPRELAKATAPAAQAAFDQLNEDAAAKQKEQVAAKQKEQVANSLGRVTDLKLEKRYAEAAPDAMRPPDDAPAQAAPAMRQTRKEQSTLPELDAERQRLAPAEAEKKDGLRIRTFESEVDPLQVSLLASGQLVVFRNVWRAGERYVQGFLLDRERLFGETLALPFQDTLLSRMSTLLLAYRGEVLGSYAAQTDREYLADQSLRGTLLYQTRLSAPLSDFELIFSIEQLPGGPGGRVIAWLAGVLALVLCGGCLLMYRLGARQIALARQQQDFVSAVSHELKTPLTSIRMYGEMLREGWAPDEKRQSYYAFIHDESERLSRLINNVLNLARMTRHELQMTPQRVSVAQLVDLIRSKAGSVIEHAGRAYTISCPPELGDLELDVDLDCFTQIVLNLVDNALKFSTKAPRQTISFELRKLDAQIEFAVRDYGPGIPRDQLGKVFGLFYRVENALTRETVGTGIGLALVSRLAQAMEGKVDAVNCDPGSEFRLRLPCIFGG